MKKILIFIIPLSFIIVSCSKIRESAGVSRKSINEFTVIENPPLVFPPDFNLLPPDQFSEKNVNNIEGDLAKEILFGLNDKNSPDNNEISTIENILNQTNASEVDENIRVEINETFASEKKIDSNSWNDDIEILNSIAESENKRNQLLRSENEINKVLPKIRITNKKKKRFFFF